jgi:hypothetical protein
VIGPAHIAASIERELAVLVRTGVTELSLRHAARRGRRVLVGPFLGEVGYELLYWIPFARRLLAELGIPRERVVTLTRGGAGCWYTDFAADHLDLFELVDHGELVERIEARRRRAADAKQLRGDPLDRELVARARASVGPATVLHPSLMFARLRGLWFRGEPLDSVLPQLSVRALDRPAALPQLPSRFFAVKLYGSDCFPPEPEVVARARAIVRQLAERADVVLLTTGFRLDDHEEWDIPGVFELAPLLRPEDNLAVQTAAVAHAAGLVSTYGGFSYLGPLLGVPTLALHARGGFHPAHLDLARRVLPAALYTVAHVDDRAAVDGFLASEVTEPARLRP